MELPNAVDEVTYTSFSLSLSVKQNTIMADNKLPKAECRKKQFRIKATTDKTREAATASHSNGGITAADSFPMTVRHMKIMRGERFQRSYTIYTQDKHRTQRTHRPHTAHTAQHGHRNIRPANHFPLLASRMAEKNVHCQTVGQSQKSHTSWLPN